jgi:hypothetical protein
MIAAGYFGTNSAGAIDYVRGPGRRNVPGRAEFLKALGFGFEPNEGDLPLLKLMMQHNSSQAMQASPTKPVSVNTGHFTLSWSPKQTPSQQEMLEATQEFLKAIGMANAMVVAYRHRHPEDTQHHHLHMVADLVDPATGLAYNRYQVLYRMQHKAIEWEQARDQITEGRQRDHAIANAARDLDFDLLKRYLGEGVDQIKRKAIDRALAMGGHFGPHMHAHRAKFLDHLRDEGIEQPPALAPPAPEQPEPRRQCQDIKVDPNDKWWLAPPEPKQPVPTPGWGSSGPQEPGDEGEPDPIPKPQRTKPKQPEYPRPYVRGDDDGWPEPRDRLRMLRQQGTGVRGCRSCVGTGNKPDFSDQTEEGRGYIQREQARREAQVREQKDRTDQTTEGREYLRRKRERDKKRGMDR